MSSDFGFPVSADVQLYVDSMGQADNQVQFDIAKTNAHNAITAAIDSSDDALLDAEYAMLLQIVDFTKYLPEPAVTAGPSALDLLRSMASMVGLTPDAMLDIAKALIQAARDQAVGAAEARAQYMEGITDAANAQYKCDLQAAEDARDAAVIEAATQIAVSAVTMVLTAVALKYASEASVNSEEIGKKQAQISDLKAGLALKPPAASQADQADITRLEGEIAVLQAKVTAGNAVASAINALARPVDGGNAIGKLVASDRTMESKVEEAESKLYATGQQLETAMRNACDDNYRSCADLISSVIDLLKSTATMTFKAPTFN